MNPSLRETLVTDLQMDPQVLQGDARLSDVGLDSVAVVELSSLLPDRVGVEIGVDELLATQTLAALDRLVAERLGQR